MSRSLIRSIVVGSSWLFACIAKENPFTDGEESARLDGGAHAAGAGQACVGQPTTPFSCETFAAGSPPADYEASGDSGVGGTR
jgi:hypothetical protein